MSDMFRYRGYQGSIEYSAEDNVLCGRVLFIKSLLMYEGDTLAELKQMFQETIDSYLEGCKADGVEPNKPCSGTLNVRLGHERHLALAEYAHQTGRSINDLICTAVDRQYSQRG